MKQQFCIPGSITIELPEGVNYSAYACGEVVDVVLFGITIRVTPDSISVSFEGETECAMVHAPKQEGSRQLGYIQGCIREPNLAARWDSIDKSARLDALVEHGPHISVSLFEDSVVVEVFDLVPQQETDISGELPTLTEEPEE